MKLVFLSILIVLIFIGFTACGSTPKAELTTEFKNLAGLGFDINAYDSTGRKQLARQMVTNGSVFKQQGRYADAIIEFQEASRWDSSASIFLAMAESYSALDKKFAAVEYCYKAIKMDSLLIPAYELLFNLYSNSHMYAEAFTVADQILKIEPNRDNKIRYAILKGINNPLESVRLLETLLTDSTDTEMMILLSSAYEQNEQYDKMAVILERVVKDQPSNYEVVSGLIEFYNDKENFANSFRLLEKSEKFFEPKQASDVYNNLGLKLVSSNVPENKTFIEKYIQKIDERFYFEWITQTIAGKLASLIHDTAKTGQFYNRAFELADTNSFVYIDAAIAYSNIKNYDKSLELLETGKNKFPDDVRFDFYICNAYILNKNFEKALEYGRKLYNSDSSNVLFITMYASIWQELKKFDESDRLYEKSLSLDPKDHSTNNNYAYSLAVRGENLVKALRMSQLSLEYDPGNAAYLDTYGWIQYQMGEYDKALESILKAIGTGEISAEVFEHLGDVYIKMKKNDLALEAYRKSLELDSNLNHVIEKINLLKN
ncbi:MAG: hypothetical protein RO257_14305 [Candidatus Kapabacteria bacterium]|nr:hypothetical protein [Candidatus Kapabacteria bacterium]